MAKKQKTTKKTTKAKFKIPPKVKSDTEIAKKITKAAKKVRAPVKSKKKWIPPTQRKEVFTTPETARELNQIYKMELSEIRQLSEVLGGLENAKKNPEYIARKQANKKILRRYLELVEQYQVANKVGKMFNPDNIASTHLTKGSDTKKKPAKTKKAPKKKKKKGLSLSEKIAEAQRMAVEALRNGNKTEVAFWQAKLNKLKAEKTNGETK